MSLQQASQTMAKITREAVVEVFESLRTTKAEGSNNVELST
jgi:hypothetical protein